MELRHWLIALLSSAALSGCGLHIGFDIDSMEATRGQDDRVTVKVGIKCTNSASESDLEDVDEVCVDATWAEPDPAVTPPDDGYDKGGREQPTGPALHTAKVCTKERWKDGEIRVLTLTSSDAIPKDKVTLITASITVSAPKSDAAVYPRSIYGNQMRSP